MNLRSRMFLSSMFAALSLVACSDSATPPVGTPDVTSGDSGADAAAEALHDAVDVRDSDIADVVDASGVEVEDLDPEGLDTADTWNMDVESADTGDAIDRGDTTDFVDAIEPDNTADSADEFDTDDATAPADVLSGDVTEPAVCSLDLAVAVLEPGIPLTGVLLDGNSLLSSVCNGGWISPEVVFRADLSAGSWCLDTFGSSFNTTVGVRHDCADDTTEFACNNDYGLPTHPVSQLELTLETSMTVWVTLEGFYEVGEYRLMLQRGACATDEVVCSDGTYVPGIYCDRRNDCAAGVELDLCSVLCLDTYELVPGIECDGIPDCSSGFDELGCPMLCSDGGEYWPEDICNGLAICFDGADERDCPEFICGDGGVVLEGQTCDSELDCRDGSDERDCPGQFLCADASEVLPETWVCDLVGDCSDGSDEAGCVSVTCPEGNEIPVQWICDRIDHCSGGADEASCPPFFCTDGEEIPHEWTCDGLLDCTDGSDEADCR
ncbi:MAG: LDL receptor domain-containing protein [Myxococcales bacterium]|nr:LDL receptor domain-containing protein [Myxococcales bacterium]